jgi:hypothetical protein
MHGIWLANVSNSRNYFSRYAKTAAHMVYRNLVDNYTKEWCGRGTGNKSLVVIAAELPETEEKNRLGRVKMQIVPDVSKKSLQTFVKENIEKGRNVVTDGWTSYTSIGESGYAHIVSPKYAAADENNLMPHVHMIVSLLKRWLLGTHQSDTLNYSASAMNLALSAFRFFYHMVMKHDVACEQPHPRQDKKPASIHSLRHTFVTHLLVIGTDIRYIQKLLGHTSIHTTERYTHVARRHVLKIQSPLDNMD